ncbi:MAG TPA: hypothetical protein VKP30_17615 [Polyangiaceae bacterium]|nr:hypothetical protein [Polyangiaceae bacterium]
MDPDSDALELITVGIGASADASTGVPTTRDLYRHAPIVATTKTKKAAPLQSTARVRTGLRPCWRVLLQLASVAATRAFSGTTGASSTVLGAARVAFAAGAPKGARA